VRKEPVVLDEVKEIETEMVEKVKGIISTSMCKSDIFQSFHHIQQTKLIVNFTIHKVPGTLCRKELNI
jgi:hypothetical protein